MKELLRLVRLMRAVDAVGSIESHLCQCLECRRVWLFSKDKLEKRVGRENLLFFRNQVEILRSLQPHFLALESLGLKISHGSCKMCLRERMVHNTRRRQAAQGFPECFGRANDGHCSRENCLYFNVCVTDPAELRMWQESLRQARASGHT